MNDRPLCPPVDPEVLEMLASLGEPGEPDLVVELVTLFLRDATERLRELTDPPLNPVDIARVAHVMKGSAGTIGAVGMREIASGLEQAAREHAPIGDLVARAGALRSEFLRVEQDLRVRLGQRGCGGAGQT